jgi:glyoxylase-like metal-dependent hydrolase (beta-lactamase superfamily II)
MNLEDHLGDILRKARTMTGVSAEAAAKAAGLTESELGSLENSGAAPRKLNFAALAPLIGLHPGKLEAIANGWLPVEKDLSAWRELRCFSTTANGMPVNSYLVWDEVSREAALFDTGWDASQALHVLTEEKLALRHVFLTHMHEDHVAALGVIRAAYPKTRVHTNSIHAPVDQRNRANDCIHLGSLRITNRDTPGHSEDGVTYLVGNWPEDATHVAIVGDAIFAGSIGRGNQSWDLARQKVREQILSLPEETLICPGHGPITTVAEEKAHNPFF